MREERALNGEIQALEAKTSESDLPTDVAELQRALQELRIKFEASLHIILCVSRLTCIDRDRRAQEEVGGPRAEERAYYP